MTGLAYYAENADRVLPLHIAPFIDPIGLLKRRLELEPALCDPRAAADYEWFIDHPGRRFRMRHASRVIDHLWHVTIVDRRHLNRTLNFSVDIMDRRIPPPAFWQDEQILTVLRFAGLVLPKRRARHAR